MTIPTLCATSTIGVTTLDYSQEQPHVPSTAIPLSEKRKLGVEHDLVQIHVPANASSRLSSRTSTSSSIDHFFSDNSEPSHSIDSHKGDDLRPVKSRKRLDDQFAAAVPLDAGHTKYPDDDSLALGKDAQTHTPLSRWKRFSNLTLSSFSSPTSSPRPDSRSISFSNASSSPLFGSGKTSRSAAPNKLVKRSSSERYNPTSSSSSFRSRIATRKTRLDYYNSGSHHQYAGHEPGANEFSQKSAEHPSGTNDQWFHNFGAKFGKLGFISPRSWGPDKSVKSQESSTGGSLTPMHSTFNSSPTSNAPFRSFSSPLQSPVSGPSKTGSGHKRTWSLSNLLNITPPLKRSQSLKAFGAKLSLRRGHRRGDQSSTTPITVVFDSEERPSKRRDVSESARKTPRDDLQSDITNLSSPPKDVDACLPSSSSMEYSNHHVNQTILDYRYPAAANIMPPSVGFIHHSREVSGHSMSPSDLASTAQESECETRGFSSCGEDEGELQSDTVFDSVRTAMTGSSYGAPDIKLRSIFLGGPNEIPPGTTNGVDAIPTDTENDQSERTHAEQDRMGDTTGNDGPAQSTADSQDHSGTFSALGFRKLSGSSSSSASTHPQSSSLGHKAYDTASLEDDKSSSSGNDEEALDSSNDPATGAAYLPAESPSARQISSEIRDHKSSLAFDTPPKPSINQADFEMKNSLFDWSEQPSAEKASVDSTPPRPKTVHGKKDAENRGSRSTGRRGATASHARSQSVPVVPDTGSKRNNLTSKFGTWGVGSKIVTEEWDEDFEFGNDMQVKLTHETEEKRVDSAVAMFVPQKIRQQQSNVLANIGLLKEWGMLIEELKELRSRATTLGLIVSEHDDFFVQVDAMVDLADQEVEDDAVGATNSISSSPGFNAKDFDASPATNQPTRGLPRPETITEDDIFANQKPGPASTKNSPQVNAENPSTPPIVGRSRKDSEAVAQSVIELLQKRNRHPLAVLPTERTSKGEKKVPFDTATLKHIVPHVNGLMHKLKQILREAEGLQNSPKRRTESPFSHVFADPMEESPTAQRQGRLAARFSNDDDDVQDSDFDFKEHELVSDIKMMNIL